jgi:hypothetical protein
MRTRQQNKKRSSHPTYSNKKNSILWNKKGVFGGIMQSIGNFFQGIMHVIPKPILFLIFLFIILLLAQLLTYIFNIFGVYCTSGDIPVTIGFNPLKTAELIGEIPQAEDLGKEILDPDAIQDTVESCEWEITSGTYTITYDNGTTENSSIPRHLYNGRTGCVTCTLATIDFHGAITIPEKWCISDAHIKPENERGTLAKWFCGARYFGRCEPPLHYYWQASTGNYVCEDQSCTGITAGDWWNNILEQNGARPLYTDAYGEAQDTSHQKFVSIQCKDVHPKLTVYGIDIFNLEYWLIIMCIAIMFWALKNFL